MPLEAGTQQPKTRAVDWTIEFKVRYTNADQAKEITEQLRAAGVVDLQEEKGVLSIKGNQDSAAFIAVVLSKHFPGDFAGPPRNSVAVHSSSG